MQEPEEKKEEVAPQDCPNKGTSPKKACDCSKAPGWTVGEWLDPWCHEGKCYSGSKVSEDCKGKSNGHQIGDGTWCWDGRRDTQCHAIESKNIKNYLMQHYQVKF